MDFITEEVKTSLGLTDDQINGLKPVHETYIAEQKKGWDNKANTDAENIIAGAIKSTQTKYNVDLPRTEGEKNADYLARLNDKVVESQKSSIEALEAEWKQKIKEFEGGDATKKELQEAKDKLDAAQIKLAEYDDLKAKADKYDPLETEYKTLKEKVFFQNEKPNFPETVNKYEAEAKWNAFVSRFNEKWEKTFDDNNKSIAVSKENPHLKKPLSELIETDEELKGLLTGRQQPGPNAKVGHKVGDLDISLPENPTSEDKSKAINEHLDKLGIKTTDRERPKKFAEILKKVEEALKK